MIEVKQTHLPLLAWRWQNGRYVLIHDDLPIGELAIASDGRALAHYHDRRWWFEKLGPRQYRLSDGESGKRIASLQLRQNGLVEEGDLTIEGTLYHCLRDEHKLPPQLSITRGEGKQPLLQFREEEQNKGRIQIDHLPSANTKDFDLLTFTGMYLYLADSSQLRTSQVQAMPPPRSTSQDPGDGGGEPEPSRMPIALSIALVGALWFLQARISRLFSRK